MTEYDVIGIDEGQFYPDLVPCVNEWVDMGKIVVVAALDGDFRRDPIGDVLKLVPKAVRTTHTRCPRCDNFDKCVFVCVRVLRMRRRA